MKAFYTERLLEYSLHYLLTVRNERTMQIIAQAVFYLIRQGKQARLLLALLLGLLSLANHATAAEDFLPPEKAFAASASRDGNAVTVTVDVAKGYYLYRDRSRFETEPAGLVISHQQPAGISKDDPYFGTLLTFPPGKTDITLQLSDKAPAQFKLKVIVQGCADAGLCYPPYTHTLSIGGKVNGASQWLKAPGSDNSSTPASSGDDIQSKGLAATLLTFFIAGLGMAFTACMYPLLPIVSSLIAGEGQHLTRRRGFFLSLTYVQGLALTYTLIGVVAGLTGSLLSVWLQQPAVILSASLMMVVFALGMFDLITIQLPSSWQSRLAASSNRFGGGKFASVFAMGALSALLIGPCVAPPLALALGYIGQTGDAWLGGAALYAMAMGLGLPLVIIGTAGGELMPRAGLWMKAVKNVFGVVMLAVAIWLAGPFLPAAITMLAWAMLALGSAVHLKAFDGLPGNATAIHKLGKALGVMLALIALLQVIGVFSGAKSPRYPLAALASGQSTSSEKPAFKLVANVSELDQALANTNGRPVMLDFYADWCVSCIEMEETTFRDPAVLQAMKGWTLLKADVTANNADHQALLKRFGLYGPPGMIFFGADGKERHRIIGYSPTNEFLPKLQQNGS